MAAEETTGAAEGGEEEEGKENEARGEVEPGEEITAAAEEEEPEDEQLLTFTVEEINERFPNPPKAPTPVLPDVRSMSPAQLEAAANQDISYGGQVRFFFVSWVVRSWVIFCVNRWWLVTGGFLFSLLLCGRNYTGIAATVPLGVRYLSRPIVDGWALHAACVHALKGSRCGFRSPCSCACSACCRCA